MIDDPGPPQALIATIAALFPVLGPQMTGCAMAFAPAATTVGLVLWLAFAVVR
ncbi:MAG: hypothetical protein JO366_10460 [Methylobacteriaceae bacterium]|nr:hypothetical protein [Methylobacteriaceae bacterium]MBV9221268.1 hypothetical protein [Methylobacteriaceae bacterium]MBV9245219.1 hypothetical protein [Methylobacteriaceae bacterium]MBV9635544.1 hypothetical protein [Methylobacteriaceae bacterium]MBV9702242.1 hypothetical protein [Methylobacteriaceae bacterium]